MHYQFEAIHPFTDGNGRTGRVLNLRYLVEKGLLDIPVLYLSHFIIQHKPDYYRAASRGDKRKRLGALDPVYAPGRAGDGSMDHPPKSSAIRELLDQTAEQIRQEAPKIYSRELAEIIFVHPYCRIGDLVTAKIAKRQSASVISKRS